ncbi:MAG: hypothetical protein HYV14_06625 [Elusimicrobia bacterium]|nr:hypothetical protein [Elusimicrobiota bacterium]
MDIFRLSDEELWRGLKALAARERVLAADAVAYVAETQRRKLHEDHGWRSMFEYCVQSLRWSEATAYRRTRAARAVLDYPAILEMLYDGRLHIEGVVILSAFLPDADFPALLLKAVGMTTKNIERLVADRRPDPPVRDSIRFVGAAPPPVRIEEPPPALALSLSRPPDHPNPPDAAPSRQAAVAEPPSPPIEDAELPAASDPPPSRPPEDLCPPSAAPLRPAEVPVRARLVRVAFTADEGLHRLVLHAQQLMRHKYPDGSLEGIFRDALRLLIAKKDLGVRAAAAAARRMRRKIMRKPKKSPLETVGNRG